MILAARRRRRRPARSVRCYAVAIVVCLAAVYGLAFLFACIFDGSLG